MDKDRPLHGTNQPRPTTALAAMAAADDRSARVSGVDVPHPTKRAKMAKMLFVVGLAFSLIGVGMAWGALVIEQTQLVPLQQSYFADNTKAQRDGAAAGSPLAEDLAEIETLKPTILTLKLVGIATVLFGIVILLGGILRMMSLVPESLSVYFRSALADHGTSEGRAQPGRSPAKAGAASGRGEGSGSGPGTRA